MVSSKQAIISQVVFGCRVVAALVALLLLGQPEAIAQTPTSPWVEGEFIVKFNDQGVRELRKEIPQLQNYSDQQIEGALTTVLGAASTDALPLIDAQGIRATSGDELDIDSAVDLLDARLVDYISPNFIRTINAIPNDPSFGSLWGLNQANDIDINAPEAWDKLDNSQASDIIVGVVDTGVDYTHSDLAANIWTNTAEANGRAGVDDDGNGVVDDIHGYNAITGSGNPFDDHSHGTHCSGTIGGVGNNGVGVTGVAWRVKIMGLKFLSSTGSGSDIDAIKAISYAITMRNVNGQLKVLSNSWGGGGYNPALRDVIARANDAGILFVAAAGNSNSNNDVTANYPSNYEVANVVAVAAIAANGTKATFSSYGATMVDLAAPGVGITSTVPGNSYASYNGTSMATPHVSGVAALMYSKVPQYSPEEARANLLANVKPIAGLNGLMVAPGVVDASAVLANPSNYPPDVQPIDDQAVSPRSRVKSVPIIAIDREGEPVTITAEIVPPTKLAAAAAADHQYDFTQYLAQNDNYYRIGEKHLRTRSNQTFFIFSDGSLWQLQYPSYSYKASVDPEYYTNPDALVNADPLDLSGIGQVSVEPGTPAAVRIIVPPGSTAGFAVAVTASDGNRSDREVFNVRVEETAECGQ